MKIATWTRTADHIGFPFTNMPAYTVLPMMPCLVYARTSTVVFAIVCTLGTWYMAKKGYSLVWLINRTKGRLRGNRQSARPIWHIRRTSFLDDPIRE